jgi:hypothetical protein
MEVLMRTKYSDCNIISIRFEKEQIEALNELALTLGLPRNTVIRRLLDMVLADVKDGRRIFGRVQDEMGRTIPILGLMSYS